MESKEKSKMLIQMKTIDAFQYIQIFSNNKTEEESHTSTRSSFKC